MDDEGPDRRRDGRGRDDHFDVRDGSPRPEPLGGDGGAARDGAPGGRVVGVGLGRVGGGSERGRRKKRWRRRDKRRSRWRGRRASWDGGGSGGGSRTWGRSGSCSWSRILVLIFGRRRGRRCGGPGLRGEGRWRARGGRPRGGRGVGGLVVSRGRGLLVGGHGGDGDAGSGVSMEIVDWSLCQKGQVELTWGLVLNQLDVNRLLVLEPWTSVLARSSRPGGFG